MRFLIFWEEICSLKLRKNQNRFKCSKDYLMLPYQTLESNRVAFITSYRTNSTTIISFFLKVYWKVFLDIFHRLTFLQIPTQSTNSSIQPCFTETTSRLIKPGWYFWQRKPSRIIDRVADLFIMQVPYQKVSFCSSEKIRSRNAFDTHISSFSAKINNLFV